MKRSFRPKHPVFTAVLIFALTVFQASAQQPPALPDSTARARILGRMEGRFLGVGAHDEYVTFGPFWKDVLLIRVPYGLNKDPVPPSFRYYLLPDGSPVHSFAEVLDNLRYRPEDGDDCLDAAVRLALEREEGTGPDAVVDEDALAKVPKKVRKKHKVRLPRVTAVDNGYRAEFFLYQDFRDFGMFRRYRAEALMKYTVTVQEGRWEVVQRECTVLERR